MNDLATIARPDVEITETSWQPVGEMSFEDWCEAGAKLGRFAEAVQWWIGDWLNYGAVTYGEKYSQALAATGYEYGSLRNMASVAGEFDLSRRRDNLSWSHHAEVAGLGPAEQEAVLDQAEREGWTRQQLRSATHGNGNGNGRRQDPSLTMRLTFEATFSNRQLMRQSAATLREQAAELGFAEKA
jgi:hypothetical protein